MKKKILSTLIPAILLAGCSTEENTENTVSNESENTAVTTKASNGYEITTRFINANIYADINGDGFPSEKELLGKTGVNGNFFISEGFFKEHTILLQAVAYQSKLVSKPDQVITKSALFEAAKGNTFVSPLTTIVVDEAKKLAARDGLSLEESLAVSAKSVSNALSHIVDLDTDDVLVFNYLNAQTPAEQRLAVVAKSLGYAFADGHRSWGIDLLNEFIDAANKMSDQQLNDKNNYIKARVVNLGDGLGYIQSVDIAVEFSLNPALKEALDTYFSSLSFTKNTETATTSRSLNEFFSNIDDVNIEVLDMKGKKIQSVAGISITVNKNGGEDSENMPSNVFELVLGGIPTVVGTHQIIVKISSNESGDYVLLPYYIDVQHQYAQIEKSSSFDQGILALSAKFPLQMKADEIHIVEVAKEELEALFKAPEGSEIEVMLAGDVPFLWEQKKNIAELADPIVANEKLTEDEKLAELDKWVAYIKAGKNGAQIHITVQAQYSAKSAQGEVEQVVSAIVEEVAQVSVFGSVTDTTAKALSGKTFVLEGHLFSEKATEHYKSCSLVSFQNGTISLSEFKVTDFEKCDLSAPLQEAGSYTQDYDGLIATIGDQKYHFSAVALTTKVEVESEEGEMIEDEQPTGEIALIRTAADNPFSKQRMVLVDVNSPLVDSFFANSTVFPGIARVQAPNGNFYNIDGEDIWVHRDIKATVAYSLGENPQLTLRFSESCPSLRLDSYSTYSQSPIMSIGAYSNTGAEVTAYTIINGENEPTCTFKYDLSELSPAFLTESSYFDVVFSKQPKSNYFYWSKANAEGSSNTVYRTNVMNYVQSLALRATPIVEEVIAP